MAELRLFAPVIVVVAVWRYRTTTTTPGADGKGGRDAYRRGWEAVERRAKAGRMRRVTAPDGVGHPTDDGLVGAPEVFLRR